MKEYKLKTAIKDSGDMITRVIILALFLALPPRAVSAQEEPASLLPPHADFFNFESVGHALNDDKTISSRYLSLEDKWKGGRREEVIPSSWRGKQIILRVERVGEPFSVMANGSPAGGSDGGQTRDFDISGLVTPGKRNDIEIRLAGGQTFGGGDVYLCCRDRRAHIDDLRLEPTLNESDGSATLLVKALVGSGVGSVRFTLIDKEGRNAGEQMVKAAGDTLRALFTLKECKPWNAEQPYLYILMAVAKDAKGQTSDATTQRVGFRNVALRHGKLYVNNRPVKMHNGQWRPERMAETAETADGGNGRRRKTMLTYMRYLKQMNINTVSVDAATPTEWLDLCDKYGLYAFSKGGTPPGSHPSVVSSDALRPGDEVSDDALARAELAWQNQQIITEGVDAAHGILRVTNENAFSDLSDVRMVWTLLANGQKKYIGTMSHLNVKALETVVDTIANFPDISALEGEVLLNVEYQMKMDKGLLRAGETIARWQLVCRPYSYAAAPPPPAASLKVKTKKGLAVYKGKGIHAVFDRATGTLLSYEADGRRLSALGGAIIPAEIERLKLSATRVKGSTFAADYMKSDGSLFTVTYTIGNDRSLTLTMPETAPVTVEMTSAYPYSRFYGRGPLAHDTAARSSQILGVYQTNAAAMTKTPLRYFSDVRWWEQIDGKGQGFRFLPSATVNAAARLAGGTVVIPLEPKKKRGVFTLRVIPR